MLTSPVLEVNVTFGGIVRCDVTLDIDLVEEAAPVVWEVVVIVSVVTIHGERCWNYKYYSL